MVKKMNEKEYKKYMIKLIVTSLFGIGSMVILSIQMLVTHFNDIVNIGFGTDLLIIISELSFSNIIIMKIQVEYEDEEDYKMIVPMSSDDCKGEKNEPKWCDGKGYKGDF